MVLKLPLSCARPAQETCAGWRCASTAMNWGEEHYTICPRYVAAAPTRSMAAPVPVRCSCTSPVAAAGRGGAGSRHAEHAARRSWLRCLIEGWAG